MNIPDFYALLAKGEFQFTTDTRTIKQGDIYFALTGPNFNGNLFAREALNKGATHAVVDDPSLETPEQCIVVPDVLTFLQELALYHRNQLDIPVIAIGGSNGKTTTKELILSVLGQEKKTHGTKGNLNNLIGVPVTLLQMPVDTEIAIIEIGTNSFGEIEQLCKIVNPNYGLITNIGKEHLEGFGDLEGVAKEESELYLYLMRNNGLAFVNKDDDWLMRMAGRVGNIFTYGQDQSADCVVRPTQVMPSIMLQFDDTNVRSSLFGGYNLSNIAAAVAIGRYFGLANESIAQGISSYVPSNNRSEIRTYGTTRVIMDSYNANPSSMEAAMRSFALIRDKHRIVVLGDMFELGEQAEKEHRAIAQFASDMKFDEVLLVGPYFSAEALSIGAKGFENMERCLDHLQTKDLNDTWILVKGSRGMKMEQILNLWEADPKA